MALCVGLAASSAARWLRPAESAYAVDFTRIPLKLAGMNGQEVPYDRSVAEYLEADEMRTIAYGEGKDRITASLIYGASWRTVHSPAACLPAQGWSVVSDEDARIPAKARWAPHVSPVMGRVLRAERDGATELVLFIFAHKGGTSVDFAEHSLAVMAGPPGAGGLSLMLTTAVPPSENGERAARKRLLALAAELYPHAVTFWYPDWVPPKHD